MGTRNFAAQGRGKAEPFGVRGWLNAIAGHPARTPPPETQAAAIFDQSGLPLALTDGMPALPPMTSARRNQLRLKRCIDVVGASVGLIGLALIFPVVWWAIQLDSPGPVLFTQKRAGRDGAIIPVYKFRTMYADAGDETGLASTVPDDRRATPIGRVLRRTSIDELPQLLNVLLGSMSLVGPRPHAIGMLASGTPYEHLVPYYRLRQAMRPGMTGWAQANGLRGPTHDAGLARRRIDHDIAYVQNVSVMLDLAIIWRTIRHELFTGS